ncbi:MAG: response regulator transcription factor [Elusimicrobiota bacterium]|nr:response regulator transcription factor [Elusimicrobiota bacterium]
MTTAKHKLLVVEDEAEYRILLREVLGQAGYTVFDASTGEAGLALYRAQSPDLILLDVMLPDMTGFDFCAQIRAGKIRPKTPILFCTVRSAVSQLARGMKSGGTDYVLKPFVPEDLLARVRAALGPDAA